MLCLFRIVYISFAGSQVRCVLLVLPKKRRDRGSEAAPRSQERALLGKKEERRDAWRMRILKKKTWRDG